MERSRREERRSRTDGVGIGAALLSFVAIGAFWVLVYDLNPLHALIGVGSLGGALAVLIWHVWTSSERERR